MLSVDTEVNGLDLRHGAKVFLVTFCRTGEEPFYFEWPVDPLTRLCEPPQPDVEEIRELVLESDEQLVGQNLKFDASALKQNGIISDWPWKRTHDCLISGHLLNSLQPHDLGTMALAYLHRNIAPLEKALEKAVQETRRMCRSKSFQERHGKWRIAEKGLPEMPSAKDECWRADYWLPRAVAVAEKYPENHPWWNVCSEYANCDSYVTGQLWDVHERLLKEKDLWEIYLERMKVLPVITDMEDHGITISQERLEKLRIEYTEESERSARICKGIAGTFGIDLELPKSGNNKSLTSFVFETLKLDSPKKSKKTGEPSLDKNVLESWEAELPDSSRELVFVKNLRGKRSRDTALGFVESYQKYWLPVWKRMGWFRLFSSTNLTGTTTLRSSMSNPNGQQVSKKEGFNLRYMFGPAPGREWWSIDYENVELRIPAFSSGEKIMIEIFEKPDDPPFFGSYHLMNASIVYPDLFWPIADKKGEFKKRYASTWYQWIKNFGFAYSYGCGPETGDRTARKSGAYNLVCSRLKEHSKLNKRQIDYANKHGYVETIPDREINPRRGYPLYCPRAYNGHVLPTTCLNFHVQSSACWVMMRAMVKVQEYLKTLPGYKLILSVHDELVFDFPVMHDGENLPVIKRIQRIMEGMGDNIGIPLTCGVTKHADNWSEGETF